MQRKSYSIIILIGKLVNEITIRFVGLTLVNVIENRPDLILRKQHKVSPDDIYLKRIYVSLSLYEK